MTDMHNYGAAKWNAKQRLKNNLINLIEPFIIELTDKGRDDTGIKVAISYTEKIDAFRECLRYVLDLTLEPAPLKPIPTAPEPNKIGTVSPQSDAMSIGEIDILAPEPSAYLTEYGKS